MRAMDLLNKRCYNLTIVQRGNLQILIIVIVAAVVGYFVYTNYISKQAVAPSGQTTQTLSPTIDPMANWKTYTNTNLGIYFSYPAELTYLYDQLKEFEDGKRPGGNLLLQNYDGSQPSKIPESEIFQLQISVENKDAYGTANGGADTLSGYVEIYKNDHNLQNSEYTSITLGGEPAIRGYGIKKNEKVPTIWTIHNSLLYTIYFETPNSKYAPWFDQIMSTFKFTQ